MFSFLMLVVFVLVLVSMWKVFEKAGQPGWAALIPIYNAYIFLKIAGKPGWWLILFFIPLVNLIVGIIASIAFAAKFGKSAGFALGMVFLPFIFIPMLAFSDAVYSPGASA